MPLVIHMEPRFIETALTLNQGQRNYIEQRKQAHKVDPLLKDICRRLNANSTELERTWDDKEEEQVLGEIRDKFDAAIALIAVAETDAEITALEKLSVTLGRRYSPQIRIPSDDIYPRLKKVFLEVDQQFELSGPGKGRRRLIRRKVTTTIAIINHALGNGKTGQFLSS